MRKALFICVAVASTIHAIAPGASAAEWDTKKYVAAIEKKLPLAEKQAEVIIKMLRNEKHLAGIKASFASESNGDYVSEAFDAIGVSWSDGIVNLVLNTPDYDKLAPFQRDDNRYKFNLLEPQIVELIALGYGCLRNPQYYQQFEKDGKDGFVDFGDFAILAKKILDIQKPLHEALKEVKLDKCSTGYSTYFRTGRLCAGPENYLAAIRYSPENINRQSVEFLQFIVELIDYKQSMGWRTPPPYVKEDFKAALERRANKGGFNDLAAPTNPAPAGVNGSGSGGGFDDLLPK